MTSVQEMKRKEVSRARTATLAAGGVLTATGIRRGGVIGIASAALGSNLIYEGVRGNSPLFRVLRINRHMLGKEAVVPHRQSSKSQASVIIDKPRHELFVFWRNFANLPRFMDYLESVQQTENNLWRWKLRMPVGSFSWDAEIYNEKPDQLIAWRAMPDASIDHAGSVAFDDATGGRGTVVTLVINYAPPLGALGEKAAALLPQEPGKMAWDALRKFKQLMETGEIITSRMRHDAMSNQAQPTIEANTRSA